MSETPEGYWDAAYRAHGPALLRYARRCGRDVSDAEELLQQTFERAVGAGRELPEDELRYYLYRIATNLVIDAARRRRLLRFVPLVDRPIAPHPFDDQEQVRSALRAIPPEQASALVLRLHEGFSRAEIAQIAGVSIDAVKSRLTRGRRNFIAAYKREEARPGHARPRTDRPRAR